MAELLSDQSFILESLQEEMTKFHLPAFIDDPIFVIDREFRVRYQNQAASDLFGGNIGKYCYVAYQGKERVCHDCPIMKSALDGKIHRTEKRIPDCHEGKFVEIAASSMVDKAGERVGGIAILRDISGRKFIEQQLRKINSLLKTIMEVTNDGILAVDPVGSMLTYNRKFAEMWKIPVHMLEQYNDGFMFEFLLDQVKEPDVFLQKIKKLKSHPEEIDLDMMHCQDGRIVEFYSKSLFIEGRNQGRIWRFRDITAFYKPEEKRKQLRGILPICSYCKRVRDDSEQWCQIEKYIEKHSEIVFSHGICPECLQKYYQHE